MTRPHCDDGFCPLPEDETQTRSPSTASGQAAREGSAARIELYYCTDPVCSYCWAFEPVLNLFRAQYGADFNFHVLMGGLLESWEGFADAANGIRAAADVTAHWREVGDAFGMPIDGRLWQSDPVSSSFPAARAYLVLRRETPALAARFLRQVREALMVFDRNIARPAVLREILDALGTDGAAVLAAAESPAALSLLRQDMTAMRQLGARGFPSLVLVNAAGRTERLAGAQPYANYVGALHALAEVPLVPRAVPPLAAWLQAQPRIFAQEIAVMYGLPKTGAEEYCRQHLSAGTYRPLTLNGEFYIEPDRPPGVPEQ